jgi:NADPH oxidase
MASPNKDGASGKATFASFLSRTTFSRPNIPHIFATKAKEFQGRTVGVFFCGPPAVSRQLLQACQENTTGGTKFVYHKENF